MAASPEIIVVSSEVELQEKVCSAVLSIAESSIKDHGFFSVGVSGGSVSKILTKGLVSKSDIDWSNWHVFFCDERHVPYNNDDSTFGFFKVNLFDHVGIKEDNVYAINPNIDVAAAAEDYVVKIRRLFPGDGVPKFDLLLLGMGPDGHTCSLFPDHPGLLEDKKLIIPITDSPKPPPSRITMTYLLLNNAANAMVIAAGSSKAEAVKKCLKPEPGSEPLPAGRVKLTSGVLTWFLDEGSARLVK
jgi:6-phosphogluconolactonase